MSGSTSAWSAARRTGARFASREPMRYVLAVVVVCVSGAARGQSARSARQPITEPGGVRFSFRDVFLEMRSGYERERVVRFGGRRDGDPSVLTFRDTILEERFGLGFEGDLYHPSLFAFQGSVVAGARQEWFHRNLPTERNREYEAGPLLEYDLRADILQDKPIAASAFARQIERFIPREFRLSQLETVTNLGAELRYQSKDLPMRLAVERFASDIDGVDRDVPGESRDEDTLTYQLDWRPSRDHSLSLNYEYLDRTTEQPGAIEVVERWHDLDILHNRTWGPQRKYEWQTQMEFRDESGTFAQDRIRFNPRLRTHHTSDLDSLVQYTFDQQAFGGTRTLTQRVDLGVTRRIYESLTLDGNLFGEVQDLPGERRGWFAGGELAAAYRKRTPVGLWQGHLGLNFASRQLDDSRTTAPVVDETIRFDGSQIALLLRDSVVLSSIRVENLDGTVRYQRDRDYRVVAYGRRTGLVRKLGGRIGRSEVARVSYLYVLPADSRIDNTNLNLEIAHLFDIGLRPYYRFGVREEKIRTRNLPPFPEEDVNDHTLGFEFRRTGLTFGAEYRIHDSTLFPDDGFRLWGNVDLLRREGTVVNWSSTYAHTAFGGDLPRRNRRFETGLSFDQELTRTADLYLAARYGNEDDSLDERTEGVTLEGRLRWMVRDVAVELTVEQHNFRDRVEDESDTRVWLQVRRNILR